MDCREDNNIIMLKKLAKEWHVPDDSSRQASSFTMAEQLAVRMPGVDRILDLGCGTGTSADLFKRILPEAQWIGLDIEESPEVASRSRTGVEFHSFDGINIPFPDESFDLIFSNQVLEHVRQPVELLKEVRRVLKPEGVMVGSTSHLEPYHSFSVRNYTPYGFLLLLEESGLYLEEIRPGIDSLTLITRLGLGRPKFFSRWWRKESPLNKMIHLFGTLTGKSQAEINVIKLIFCGQFAFLARRNVARPSQIPPG